jgi:hypothetical protein
MLPTLLSAAVVTAASVLPLPLPSIPGIPSIPTIPSVPTSSAPSPPQGQPIEVSGTLDAPDGRLKRGCKPYAYSYAVTSETDDWTFDISMQDRTGKGVNAQSLLGPNDATSGVLRFTLCRAATRPGTFTLTGDLAAYEGTWRETHVAVTDTFLLRRTRR